MTREELRKVIDEELGNIAPEINADDIDDAADIRQSFDIDSMGFLTFITALHKRLNVNVPESDYPKLVTRGGAITYLADKCTATIVMLNGD